MVGFRVGGGEGWAAQIDGGGSPRSFLNRLLGASGSPWASWGFQSLRASGGFSGLLGP